MRFRVRVWSDLALNVEEAALMVVRRHHVTENKMGDVYRAEYTLDCGWIDWSHATPGRKDIKMIWGDLPPQRSTDNPDVRLRDKNTGVVHQYYRVRVPLLKGSSVRQKQTWYVKRNHDDGIHYYKRAALALFELSCSIVEQGQEDRWQDVVGQTGWSMEDLVSNLMAFYGHVEELDREAIISKCGGWTEASKAAKMSSEIYEILDDNDVVGGDFYPKGIDFGQPSAKSRSFREAYLFNKHLPARITHDNRGGWNDVPKFFRSITPLGINLAPISGSDLLSSFQLRVLLGANKVEYASTNTREQSYAFRQQTTRFAATGAGTGRRPGRLDINIV